MQFTDHAVPSGMRVTHDGYLVGEVRCARTGCQQYMAHEVGMPGDGAVTVYRPESAVFDTASLSTFAGKPVTMGHPSGPVTADNWKGIAVGDVGSEIARDGDFVRVPIKLMDAAAIQAVQAGTREISMGYTTDMRVEDGTAPDGTPYQAVQTGPIRINHLAIVPKARGGPSLRLGDTWGATPISQAEPENNMADALRTVVVDGLSVSTTDQGAQAIEKLTRDRDEARTAIGSAKVTHAAEIAAKDEEIGSLKADLVKAQDAAKVDIDRLVADRASLVAQVHAVDASIDVAGKSDTDLRKAAVASRMGDEAVTGVSDAEIAGMFKVVASSGERRSDPVREALRDGVRAVNNAEWGDSVFASAGVSMKGK